MCRGISALSRVAGVQHGHPGVQGGGVRGKRGLGFGEKGPWLVQGCCLSWSDRYFAIAGVHGCSGFNY